MKVTTIDFAKSTTDSVIQKERQSNFELLRILCIVAIIANHYAIHPTWDFQNLPISFNRLLIQTTTLFGKPAVNCFVLISGYFLIESKCGRSVNALLKFWV